MEIRIEPMTLADIPDVSKVVIEAFNKPPVNESWTQETSDLHLKEVFGAEYSFVAKIKGEIVGALVGDVETFDKGPVYFIDTLAVKKKYRGKGAGQKLMDKATGTAKMHNIKSISLESSAKLRAFAWYKKLGFEESGWVELTKTLV